MRWNNMLLLLLSLKQLNSAYKLFGIQHLNKVRITKCDAPKKHSGSNGKFFYLQDFESLIIWEKGNEKAALSSIVEGLKEIVFQIEDKNTAQLKGYLFNLTNNNFKNMGKSNIKEIDSFHNIFCEQVRDSYGKYGVSLLSNTNDISYERSDQSKFNKDFQAEASSGSAGCFLVPVGNCSHVQDAAELVDTYSNVFHEVDGFELKEEKAKTVKVEQPQVDVLLNTDQNELKERSKVDNIKKSSDHAKNKIIVLFVFGLILLLLVSIFIYYCFARLDESDYDIV